MSVRRKKRPSKVADTTPRLSILALDLATSTGWALLNREGNVTSGYQVSTFAGASRPECGEPRASEGGRGGAHPQRQVG